jgi:hypothetical protein
MIKDRRRTTITAEAGDQPPPRLRRSAEALRAKAEFAERYQKGSACSAVKSFVRY